MEAKKIWRDSDGRVVFWQRPNKWLIIWAAAELSSRILQPGKVQETVYWLGEGSLATWALLEIFRGVNYFRRGLGVVVLLVTVASIFKIGL